MLFSPWVVVLTTTALHGHGRHLEGVVASVSCLSLLIAFELEIETRYAGRLLVTSTYTHHVKLMKLPVKLW